MGRNLLSLTELVNVIDQQECMHTLCTRPAERCRHTCHHRVVKEKDNHRTLDDCRGGRCPPRGCLLGRGVSVPMHAGIHTHPVNRITDRQVQKHYLSATSLRTAKILLFHTFEKKGQPYSSDLNDGKVLLIVKDSTHKAKQT